MSSRLRPPKPSRLPSSFKPSPVEWKPVRLPAPERGWKGSLDELVRKLRETTHKPKAPRLPPPKAGHVEILPSSLNVLVCDIDEANRMLVEEALLSWGFNVRTVTDGRTALAFLEGKDFIPHLVLTGGRLAEMSGVELARQYGRLAPDAEVVFMAGSDELSIALHVKGTRLHEMVLKPILRMEDLRAAVANACQRLHLQVYAGLVVREIDRHHRLMEIEAAIAAELSENIEIQRVMEIGCRGLSELFDEAPVVFLQYIPAQRGLVASTRHPAGLFAGAQPKFLIPPETPAEFKAVLGALADLEKDGAFQDMMRQASEMSPEIFGRVDGEAVWRTCILETRGIPRGIVSLRVPRNAWHEKTDRLRLERNVQALAKSYEIALLHMKLGESAIQDPFTGLANRRYFEKRFKEEVQKASRLRHPVGVFVVKALPAPGISSDESQESLRARTWKLMSGLMTSNFRSTDVLAHFGEGVWAVALPHTSIADALRKAEQFRSLVRESSEHGLFAAIGVAEYPGHARTAEGLLGAAEKACRKSMAQAGVSVQLAEVGDGYVPPFVPEPVRPSGPVETPSKD